jgi:hypothetical protein
MGDRTGTDSGDLTAETAAEIARWLAVADGYPLEAFLDPEVRQEQSRWVVTFRGRSGQPGDHFSVALEAATRTARIIAGR